MILHGEYKDLVLNIKLIKTKLFVQSHQLEANGYQQVVKAFGLVFQNMFGLLQLLMKNT